MAIFLCPLHQLWQFLISRADDYDEYSTIIDLELCRVTQVRNTVCSSKELTVSKKGKSIQEREEVSVAGDE